MKNEINAGKLITSYITQNKISKTELSRITGFAYTSLLNHLATPSLKTGVLVVFSRALKHNFFLDIAATLPAEFTSNAPEDSTKDNTITNKDKQITTLQEELRLVKAERDILLDVLKKHH